MELRRSKLLAILLAIVFVTSTFFGVGSVMAEPPSIHEEIQERPLVRVDKIKFCWGPESGAIQMIDHVTDSVLPVPEWDYSAGTNEPACYVRNSTITIQAQFVTTSFLVRSCRIWAAGSLDGLGEQTLTFRRRHSKYVSFTANMALPNVVSVNNVTWEWWYRDVNGQGTPPVKMLVSSSHEVFSVWQKPLDPPIYKSVVRWTTQWATGAGDTNTTKDICDAIIANEYLSGLHYGYPAWTVDDILDTGGGMCGGWYQMFHEMAGSQGAFVYDRCYILKDDAAPPPEVKWMGMVIKDPGLNNEEPTFPPQWWYDVDEVYPCPTADDWERVFEKRYIFYSPNDGHCINFLLYEGKVYLYDASFGTGPWPDTFDLIPLGHMYGEELHDFRVNYHDIAIDHMRGTIYYDAGRGCQTDYRVLDVKTSLIPDLRVPGDPDTYEMHYYWVGSETEIDFDNQMVKTMEPANAKGDRSINGYDETYEECMKKLETVLGDPYTPLDWLAVKGAIMLLGEMGDPRCSASLARVLERKEDLVLMPGSPLPGVMSPLDMLKAEAMDALVKMNTAAYLPQMLRVYHEAENMVLRDIARRAVQALGGKTSY